MSFGDHVILWLHVAAAIFTIGPGTAAIMSTPRYIRKRDPAVVGYLFRSTRIYTLAALLTLIFGLVLTGMTHKFSQWWISASLTLFVVAFVLLVIILRDQRKALTALAAANEAAVAGGVKDGNRSEVSGQQAATGGAATGQPAAIAAAGAVQPAGSAADEHRAAVERGRIASLGGLTAIIWLVILIFMVWH